MELDKLLVFDWDKGNIVKNWERHKIKHTEAEEVFVNEPKFIIPDTKHSEEEERYAVFGRTNENRLLSLTFTKRNDKVRVISARNMSKRERNFYEELKINAKI